MNSNFAEFTVGQIIHHKLFNYRGVIIDVDPGYQRSDEWYAVMAKSRPAKNQPWYHILVDDTDYMTYVAEQNLGADHSGMPISHPEINKYFSKLDGDNYETRRLSN